MPAGAHKPIAAYGGITAIVKVPIIVTENGLNTEDDAQRVDFLRTAIAEVGAAIADGAPVGGYMCWSAMDNFEWIFGYGPKFGIIAVGMICLLVPIRSGRAHV